MTSAATELPGAGTGAVAGPRALTRLTEDRRLEALDQLQLLDTDPEERFDRITRLAQRVFDVPIATVTLVDADRLWFKSAQGLPVAQVDRQASFCDRTISLNRTLVVPDAVADPIFCASPAVVDDPHVRFYAGQPLTGPGGLVVGTLCLFDVVPRSLDDEQRALLQELGGWAEAELTRSVEADRAREVQQALLPDVPPELAGYQVAGTCLPAMAVGGDLFDLYLLDGDLVLTLADVMGKGTGAAILMATVRAVFRATAGPLLDSGHGRDGGELLTAVNRALLPDLARTGSFVTAFHARLDAASGRVRYADAGQGLALVRRADGRTEHLPGGDLPLGIELDEPWSEHELTLDPGDTLFCCSDGLFDLFGGTRDALDSVAALLRDHPDPDDLLAAVRARTAAAPVLDDVTAVAVRRGPQR